MIASMAQTQNFPQHRKFIGIPPGGPSHKTSLSSHSSSSFVNSLGGPEFRNPEVPSLGEGWQSDLHLSTRWPNNSNESSGLGCPVSESISAASSELFGNSIGNKDWQQVQYMDSNPDRYSASLASMLPGGSPGLGRSMSSNGLSSSPLVGGMLSSSPRLCQGWNSNVDHGNLGLTVDPSKGGFALQGAGHPASLSLPRFSTNPGFAERAARYSAFGNGQYSPTFPLTENGNVGRDPSPSFENESKRVKASASSPPSDFISATCSTEISGGRNSVHHGNPLDGLVSERLCEDVNGKGEAKASASILLGSSPDSPDEQDDGDQEQNADERERVTSESDASDVSRAQETSCADQAMVDLGRTSSGTKRKSFTSDDPVKEVSSRTSKDQKGSGGHSKRFKRIEGAGDKDEQKSKAERSGSENSGISNSPAAKESTKPAEQPKLDYIHVRARRGQATDSHSLAERVRREKISERMKFLQDLVPGCSKVTGKAVMLDEIINYVQSIQRQVEFLSMKLAAVTPRPEFNIDSFFSKQLQAGNGYGIPSMVEPRMDHPESSLPFPRIQSQPQVHLQHGVTRSLEFQQAVDANLRRMSSPSLTLPRAPIESFGDGLPQVSSLWDGDLQSVVQMGFGQSPQGDLPPGHMKMEL